MGTGRRLFDAMLAALVWFAPGAQSAVADPPKLFGETPRTAQRFAEAAELEKQGRWADAVELYLRISDEATDDLVPADGRPDHLLPARGLIHRRIAVRAELLSSYRARIESRGKRLLEQGQAARDPQILEQVVEQFFCSRSAETAIHLLGDLACERGEFDQARRYWRLLEPADSPNGLSYPDPQGGTALPRAKQILARLLAGDQAGAAAEFAAFRKSHADAVGHLAGRDGNLVTTLQGLLEAAETVRVPAPIGLAPSATTFGGDASRNGTLMGMLPPFSPEPRYPAIALPGAASSQRLVQKPPIRAASLAFFTIIAHKQVFVGSPRGVFAYDLATGQLSGRYILPGDSRTADAKLPLAGGSFTLTVSKDKVYARLGTANIKSLSTLVCLQWRPNRPTPEQRLQPVWSLPARKVDSESSAAWEGAPIVRDRRLYAATTRLDGARAVTAIACYPAANPAVGPIWQKDVYETAAEAADRDRPHLLTMTGNSLVLCSDAGAILALDAANGSRSWAFRYPSGEGPGPAEPNPCVVAWGRLYVAPSDSDRIWCLDAASGAPLWASEPVQVAHLLGVVRDRVICILGGFHSGICAFETATGRRIPDWGYRVFGTDALAPLGRGLLFGDRVYWPTRAAGLRELRWDGSTGFPPTAFRDLPGGNLAYGDGCLVVATADRLHVLVGDVPEVGGPGQHVGKYNAAERHDILLWQAESLERSNRPSAEVRATFEAAAASEFPPERRFLALVRWAEFELARRARQAAATIAKAAAQLQINNVVLRDADGIIRTPRDWAAGILETSSDSASGPRRLTPVRSDRPPDHYAVPLRFPLEPAWRLPLDPKRERALLPEGEFEPRRVYVAGRHCLACRDVSDGAERWRIDLDFSPAWLTIANASLIVAGDNGAARLNADDGRVVWQFRVPEIAPWFDRPGWRDPNAVAPRERLDSIHWAGGRLVARLGARLLLALDGETGRLLWQRPAPLAVGFQPAFFAVERRVALQTTDGQWWLCDAATGRVLRTGSAPTAPWPNPPLALADNRLLVVEDGRLVALDRTSGSPAWTWDLRDPLSLTGELARTRLVGGVVLVGIPRNGCFAVARLDPATGRSISDDEVAISRGPCELSAVAFDGDMYHVAADGELRSIDCRSGAHVAQVALRSAGRWRVQSIAGGLLVWSAPPVLPHDIPAKGGSIFVLAHSENDHRSGILSSLPLGDKPGNALQAVRVCANELIVVSTAEVRGFRGANREVK